MNKNLRITCLLLLTFIFLFTSLTEAKIALPKYTGNEIKDFFQVATVKYPYEYSNMKLFFITAPANYMKTNFITLDDSLQNHYLAINEYKGGQVNYLEVENVSKSWIFMMTGEIVTGCKQNRMLKQDILLRPFSGKTVIPVYCVEQRRWTSQYKGKFTSYKTATNPSVRQMAKQTNSQSYVWSEVDKTQKRIGVHSKTGDLNVTYTDKVIKNKIDNYYNNLINYPAKKANIVGVVVVVGNRIIAADLFCNHQLFMSLWPKLLKSYTVEALNSPQEKCAISIQDAENFVAQVLQTKFERQTIAGEGHLVNFKDSKVSGSALLYGGKVIHLEIFPALNITTPTYKPDLIRRYPRQQQTR